MSKYFFQKPQTENSGLNLFEWEEIRESFSQIEEWREEDIRKNLLMLKKIFFPFLRKKLTGENKGPELAKIVYLLGKNEVLNRLESLSM